MADTAALSDSFGSWVKWGAGLYQEYSIEKERAAANAAQASQGVSQIAQPVNTNGTPVASGSVTVSGKSLAIYAGVGMLALGGALYLASHLRKGK